MFEFCCEHSLMHSLLIARDELGRSAQKRGRKTRECKDCIPASSLGGISSVKWVYPCLLCTSTAHLLVWNTTVHMEMTSKFTRWLVLLVESKIFAHVLIVQYNVVCKMYLVSNGTIWLVSTVLVYCASSLVSLSKAVVKGALSCRKPACAGNLVSVSLL